MDCVESAVCLCTALASRCACPHSWNSTPSPIYHTHTDDLRNLVALQVLDLRHNRFKDIPSIVCQLPALQTLYLRCNKIKVVQPEIGNLTVSAQWLLGLVVISDFHCEVVVARPSPYKAGLAVYTVCVCVVSDLRTDGIMCLLSLRHTVHIIAELE